MSQRFTQSQQISDYNAKVTEARAKFPTHTWQTSQTVMITHRLGANRKVQGFAHFSN